MASGRHRKDARRRARRTDSTDAARPALPKRRFRRLLFALLPAIAILIAAELVVRAFELADPSLRSIPLPEEYAGLLRPDGELFWSLRPNLRQPYRGTTVTTNAVGLRGADVSTPAEKEFRILSLGESSTFGVGVSDDETYSARLERNLNDGDAARSYRVINAGVPAYSSFQGLQFLKRRGLALSPDMVLFYHELNDYLPSTFRDSSNTEFGVSQSDEALHESRTGFIDRHLLSHWALYRFLRYRVASYRIRSLQRQLEGNPLMAIGLPDIGLPPRLISTNDGDPRPVMLESRALPRRVTERERRYNLEELHDFCQRHDITLVLIHPSYRDSYRHRCLLTDFCARRRLPMFEAYDALHPEGVDRSEMFLDAWHPTAMGHQRLADMLTHFLLDTRLVSIP